MINQEFENYGRILSKEAELLEWKVRSMGVTMIGY